MTSNDSSSDAGLRGLRQKLADAIHSPAFAGVLLVACAALAMLVANSPLRGAYEAFLHWKLGVPGVLFKPMLLWINDALMAVFFLFVALEIKREMVMGQLRSRAQLALPLLCALGGMVVPALIYLGFAHADEIARRGWAIPSATDIAFALGILALLGSRVPLSMKVLLSAIAVLDDLGAIIVIALFYGEHLAPWWLLGALGVLVVMGVLNKRGHARIATYLLLGTVLWFLVLKSGIHATIAGVATGLMIPLNDPGNPVRTPLETLERRLHPPVSLFILPLFAFANAGLDLSGIKLEQALHAVPMGVMLGLVLGKPVGIVGSIWLAGFFGLRRPPNLTWNMLIGLGLLCGIGFTMSLFIGSLAFAPEAEAAITHRLGILAGSTITALAGYFWLRRALKAPA